MDVNREYYELGLPIIEKAGVAHKIDFREGPALPLLDELLKDVRELKVELMFYETYREKKNELKLLIAYYIYRGSLASECF